MKHAPMSRAAVGALALLGIVFWAGPVLADIRLAVVANPDPALPGELLDVEITVTNDGAARSNVTVLFDFPANVNSLSDALFDGDCPSSACEAGEQATFDIPSLPAGKGLTFSMPVRVQTAASGGTVIPFDAEVFDDGMSQATASDSVTVTITRELELALADGADPVVPGAILEYTLTYGVIETSGGAAGTTLRMPVPSGTTFESASDGGTENGGLVEWNLGNLNPRTVGERQVRFLVDPGVASGSVLRATASFFDIGSNSIVVENTTRAQADTPIKLGITAGPDAVRPGEIVDLELTVTNDGFFDRSDVVIELEIPEEFAGLSDSLFEGDCPSSACEPAERASFNVGTLPGGEGRNFSIPARLASSTVDGKVVAIEAQVEDSVGDTREASTSLTTLDVRELELALVENRDPVAAGERLEYTLIYGLRRTGVGVQDVRLQLPLPAGTNFVSASDGGSLTGNVIEWSLGNLDPGTTGERRATLESDLALDEGTILLAEATLVDSSGSEVRQQAATRVRQELPFEVDIIGSPDPARPTEVLDVELSVTNTGVFDLSSMQLTLEIPDDVVALSDALFDGDCPSSACEPGETATFSIGTLGAGKSVMYSMPMQVAASVIDGTTISFEAQVTDGSGRRRESSTSIVVDDTRSLDLGITERDEPLTPGSTITFNVMYGTYATAGGAPGTSLRFALPTGTTLLSASDGGTFSNGFVEWSTGSIDPGGGGDRTVIVEIDPQTTPGTILQPFVLFGDSSSPQEQVRFEESFRVQQEAPLDVDLNISQFFVSAGTTLDLTLSVTNTSSFERTGVVLDLEVPGGLIALSDAAFAGDCPSSACEARETAVFNVGVLGVGESVSFPVPFVVAAATEAGTVINFDALVTDNTGFIGNAGDIVMVGTDFDGGRSAGAGRVSDGLNGVPLTVSLSDSCEEITLTWEPSCLSADDDYAIYEGTIGDFGVYTPRTCSTGGETSYTFEATPGTSEFYLVVPQNGIAEGSYGVDSSGFERDPRGPACLVQEIASTCP